MSCPDRATLLALQVGELAEPAAQTVIEHLSDCSTCQDIAKDLSRSEDRLASQLRKPVVDDARAEEPQCRKALARAKRIARAPKRKKGARRAASKVSPKAADEFDPYYQWLGIPPEYRPVDHYRLLGIPSFTDDPVVIDAAADQRMVHVRTFQLGKYSDLSQKLLNQIAAAKSCLKDPKRKTAYDEKLRKRLPATGEPDKNSPSVEAKPGGHLGEYELLEKLGEGGMGTVYRARHTRLDRIVALKLLAQSRLDDAQAIARFDREMKAVGQLNHPNIVGAHDAREVDGMRFLVMEFVEGEDLSSLAKRRGPLPVAEACELVRQAAVGLQYVHENGLVHRDIKPSNLMLTREGTVKILDLGLARLQLDAQPDDEVTSTGQAMGTVDYMAPEQISDSHSVDIRADIYSLGCTLYQLLASRAPFNGPEYTNHIKKLYAHTHDPVPPIGKLREDVPPPLVIVLERMLAKDPNERYATPQEVVDAIARFADGNDDASLPAAQTAASGAPVAAVSDIQIVATQSRKPRSTPQGLGQLWHSLKARRWKPWEVAVSVGGLGALLVALGVIITIARDGKETKLDVPDGSLVAISEGGSVRVALPPGTAAPGQKPPAIAPLDPAAAKRHQQEVADRLGLPVQRENSIGMKLVLIPPGEFMMGSPDTDKHALVFEKPQHRVRISKPFYLGVTEVTRRQYEEIMRESPGKTVGDSSRPAGKVASENAVEFCKRLSQREDREYRLPTEAEWEYACRAGSTMKWCFGDADSELGEYAWFSDNSTNQTHPVAQRKPNAWGLHDMYGNAWEWCGDWFEADYYARSPLVDPAGPAKGSLRVFRGGSWYDGVGCCRSASRVKPVPDLRFGNLGFRVVCSVEATGKEKFVPVTGLASEPPKRLLGYQVHEDLDLARLAGHTNLVLFFLGGDSYRDLGRMIESARRRGLKVVLSFGIGKGEFDKPLETIRSLVKAHPGTIAAVCCCDPYLDGATPEDLARCAAEFKRATRGLPFWTQFVAERGGRVQQSPVPDAVDTVVVRVFGGTPEKVAGSLNRVLPAWKKRAGKRPVLLFWCNFAGSGKPKGLVPNCTAGLFERCGKIVEQHQLAGAVFDSFGRGYGGVPGIETREELVREVRQVGQNWRVGADTDTSPGPKLWQPEASLEAGSSNITALAFSPDGKTLATGAWKAPIRTWDVATRKMLHEMANRADQHCSQLLFSPDGSTLIGGHKIHQWDARTGSEQRLLDGVQHWMEAIAIGPDGAALASIDRGHNLNLYDLQTGKQKRTVKTVSGGDTEGWPLSMAWSPDGKRLAIGFRAGRITLRPSDLSEPEADWKAHTAHVRAVAFLDNGKQLASAAEDGILKLWNVADHRLIQEMVSPGSAIRHMAVSPDGQIAATANSNGTVVVWNVNKGAIQEVLRGFDDEVRQVAFSADGNRLAAGGKDGTVRIWRRENGKATDVRTAKE